MEWDKRPSTVFNELRLGKELCDVVISVDGVEFNAHKIILCSCSNYFRVLFNSGWSNAERRVYKIPGVSPDMMRLIIEYAYSGTARVTANNVEPLLIAANQFNVMGVVRLCCEFLKSQLCSENCVGIWKFTDHYFCPDLRGAVFMFILHHFEEVAKESEEFLELSVSDLKDIIEKDELNVKEEAAVFETVLRWIAHDPWSRRQHAAVLLGKVRLALMPPEYFLNNVKTHDYVQDNDECRELIIEALLEMSHINTHGPPPLESSSPLSRPRLPFAVLFAIGGWNGGSPTNAIETYDARADRWLTVMGEQEGPLAYHSAVYLQGFVYAVGGFDGVDCISRVKRFDLRHKTWQEVAPMHSKRCYVSTAVLHGHIYAMGGLDGHVRLSTAERYDPEANQWTLIAPMHEQRSDASATTLQDKVYICGGFNGTECLFTAEAYNATTDQWSFIAPMGSRRSGVGVIACGSEVYAVGGFNGFSRLRSAEAYNPQDDAWHPLPDMLTPRSNFGIGVVEELLFVVGGFNGSTTTFNVECYNKRADDWYDIRDMGVNRSALSCCVVPGLSNIAEYVAQRDSAVDSPAPSDSPAQAAP